MNHSQLTIEAINDPSEIALHQPHWERSKRNWAWLRDHWSDLLPQAFGKFLAVAGEEALVADSLEEALTWAKTAHPEDTGRIVEYVTPPQGPRCYAQWSLRPYSNSRATTGASLAFAASLPRSAIPKPRHEHPWPRRARPLRCHH